MGISRWKAVILDLDGTLLRSDSIYIKGIAGV